MWCSNLMSESVEKCFVCGLSVDYLIMWSASYCVALPRIELWLILDTRWKVVIWFVLYEVFYLLKYSMFSHTLLFVICFRTSYIYGYLIYIRIWSITVCHVFLYLKRYWVHIKYDAFILICKYTQYLYIYIYIYILILISVYI